MKLSVGEQLLRPCVLAPAACASTCAWLYDLGAAVCPPPPPYSRRPRREIFIDLHRGPRGPCGRDSPRADALTRCACKHFSELDVERPLMPSSRAAFTPGTLPERGSDFRWTRSS